MGGLLLAFSVAALDGHMSMLYVTFVISARREAESRPSIVILFFKCAATTCQRQG